MNYVPQKTLKTRSHARVSEAQTPTECSDLSSRFDILRGQKHVRYLPLCWGVKLRHPRNLVHSVVGLEEESEVYQEPQVSTMNDGH